MNVQEVTPLQIGSNAVVDQTRADNAKKIVLSLEEVIDVKAVSMEDNIYLAPNTTHFARLRLKQIRKNSFDRIKKRYPDANIHVSTDRKIFMELGKLEQQLKEGIAKEEDLEKSLKKLEEDMKG